MKYQISMAPSFMHDMGLRYHDYGTLKDTETGTALFDFYKCDVITDEQRAKLKEWCPDVRFMGAGSVYAPELSKPLVCFPKAGFYRVSHKFT